MTNEEIKEITRVFTIQDLLLVRIISLLRDTSTVRENDWLSGLSKIKEEFEDRKDLTGDDLTHLNLLLEHLMN